MPDPHEVDAALVSTCVALGYTYQRREGFEVTDDAALQAAGLLHLTPNWAEIRRRRAKGEDVAGVRSRGWEFVLRRAE